MVYCKNLLFPLHFVDLTLYFHFESNKQIELASHLIYRNCTANPSNSNI